jgi:hypothetical protein
MTCRHAGKYEGGRGGLLQSPGLAFTWQLWAAEGPDLLQRLQNGRCFGASATFSFRTRSTVVSSVLIVVCLRSIDAEGEIRKKRYALILQNVVCITSLLQAALPRSLLQNPES